MDILNEFRQWIVAHWSEIEAQGIRIALGGQTPQQTVKTNQLSLYAQEERYQFSAILGEFGNCDVTLADMEAESSVPVEECVNTLYFEGVDSPAKISAMMEGILTAFRTKARLIEALPPPV